MNNFIEEVREWFLENVFGKIVGSLIILYVVSGLLWAIVEPLSAGDKLNENYKYIHIGLTFIITIGIIIYIINTNKPLITINHLLLNNWNSSQGLPIRTIQQDGKVGKYIDYKGTLHDASDYILEQNSQLGKSLTIEFLPVSNFTIYAYVNMISSNSNGTKKGYIAIGTHIAVLYMLYDDEWHFPADFYKRANNWHTTNINLKAAVRKTYGTNSWQYHSIIEFRIRGEGKLHNIIVK